MKLTFRRTEQKYFFKKIKTVAYRIEFTEEEKEIIQQGQLGSYVFYRNPENDYTDPSRDVTLDDLVKVGVGAVELVSAEEHQLLAIEDQIKSACAELKKLLDGVKGRIEGRKDSYEY